MSNISTDITRVTDRGQVSIPTRVREAAGIHQGDRLRWDVDADGGLRVTVLHDGGEADPRRALGFAARHGLPTGTTAQVLAELRGGE